MRTIDLTITALDGVKLVHLRWCEGRVAIIFAVDDMKPAVDRWLRRGAVEWIIDEEVGPDVKVTPVSDPEFLSCLRSSLSKQFTFSYVLKQQLT